MAHDPLIVALDVPSAGEALALVTALGDQAWFYKVGLELYSAAGPDIISELIDRGKRVFADLKFYDIGETVKRSTARVARLGATFLTIHGSGQVMRAAVHGRGGSDLKLLAVTVLTSFDQSDLREFGYACSVRELTGVVVAKALETGVDGVIASPVDAAAVRAQAGPDLLIVTPGVRSQGSAIGDQKRVATPAEAIRDGADYLVIGRQVTRSANPRAAIAEIREEIGLALHAGP